MEEQIIAGGLTQTRIDRLKKKHGSLTLVTLEGDTPETPEHFWLKKPSMATVKAATAIAESDPMESAIIYFKNCLVMGDDKVVEDVDRWLSLAPHLDALIETRSATVKNF